MPLPYTCTSFQSLLCLQRGCSLAGRRASGYPIPHLTSYSCLAAATHTHRPTNACDAGNLDLDVPRSTGPGDEICTNFGGVYDYCDDLCTFALLVLYFVPPS